MPPADDRPRTLAELAEASGIPARTIRFYIARGLVEGPVTAGRGASYTANHLARLQRIKELQSRGLTLAEIGRSLPGAKAERDLPAPSAWWNYPVAEDVIVLVRAGVSPWRARQVLAALQQMTGSLSMEATGREEEDEGER